MIERARVVESLAAEEFDLVVVGGGITGAAVALDAAARGLRTALLERRDYAGGASGRSSKLLGGALAHLRDDGPGPGREARRERDLVRELAPHLVRPVRVALPSGRLLDDLQVDDVRLVLALLSAAERKGAVCANRLEAVAVLERPGGIAGVEVRDTERGGRFVAATDRLVNATGAWADRPPWTDDARPPSLPRRRGTHIVLGNEGLPLAGTGVVVPLEHRPGVLAVPWLGRILVGPTEDPHRGDPDQTRPPGADVDRLLAAANSFFGAELGPGDVVGAFAGIWSHLPARAAVRVDERGIVTVAAASSPPGGGPRSARSIGCSSATATRRPAEPTRSRSRRIRTGTRPAEPLPT
jgi:glycerol-3-phosphate dehydrogenase